MLLMYIYIRKGNETQKEKVEKMINQEIVAAIVREVKSMSSKVNKKTAFKCLLKGDLFNYKFIMNGLKCGYNNPIAWINDNGFLGDTLAEYFNVSFGDKIIEEYRIECLKAL